MAYRVLIIDDEALARQRVARLLEQQADFTLVGECRNGAEAIKTIQEQRPDLIFLDIQMKDMSGFDVLKQLPPEDWPLTVFVTAYNEYAVQAFDMFALDYLLKPFKEERFFVTLGKALVRLNAREEHDHLSQLRQIVNYLIQHPGGKIALKQGSKISMVATTDIRYVEASGYYIEVFVEEGKRLLLRESMTNMLEQLALPNFIRIHRSTIINTDFLKEIKHTGTGDIMVLMQDGKSFRVSKSYKDELFQRLKLA